MTFVNPEFFDTFGIVVFLFITSLSLWSLNKKQCPPEWALFVLLLIGLSGLLVDGFIVYVYLLEPHF